MLGHNGAGDRPPLCYGAGMPFDPARLSDEDRAAIGKLKERWDHRWLEIMDQPKALTDDEGLRAMQEELHAILAKYDTGNLNTA